MAEVTEKELDSEKQTDVNTSEAAGETGQETSNILGEEYKELFAPDGEEFDINSIPDRDANELSKEEMERLAKMQLDDLFDSTDSVSIESLFGDGQEGKKEAAAENVEEITKPEPESEEIIQAVSDSQGEEEISAAQLFGFGTQEKEEPSKQQDEDVLNETVPLTSEQQEIQEEQPKKAGKKKKDKKKDKNNEELEEGLPKKSFGQKIKGLFFEIDDTGSNEIKGNSNQDETVTNTNESREHTILGADEELDENERLLKSMYGDDIDVEAADENAAPVKLGFFDKIKLLFNKKREQNMLEEQQEEEAQALDNEERKAKKQAKKEESAAKKEEAKAQKEAKKKEPKPKKESKPKKVKQPPKPQDLLKIKPKTIITIILFVVGLVLLVNLANSTSYYRSCISKAKLYFQNGDYAAAYKELSGLSLEEADESLYDQICVVMFIEKQHQSYLNYTKLNMRMEALDSLIKGIARYQKYLPRAEKLGMSVQFEAAKDKIVEDLQSGYGISYEKAVEYAKLSADDFVQYYNTIETYKGE